MLMYSSITRKKMQVFSNKFKKEKSEYMKYKILEKDFKQVVENIKSE